MKVNINDIVRIRLTDNGKRIWKEYWEPYTSENSKVLDPEDTVRLSLWEVMNIFGSEMYNGNPDLPFETTLEVETD